MLHCRPKLKQVQEQVQKDVKRIMSEQLRIPSASLGHQVITKSDRFLMKPSFIASTSVFGPKVILSDCSATKQSINCIFLFAFISVYHSTFQESSLVHFHVFTSNLCN